MAAFRSASQRSFAAAMRAPSPRNLGQHISWPARAIEVACCSIYAKRASRRMAVTVKRLSREQTHARLSGLVAALLGAFDYCCHGVAAENHHAFSRLETF